MKSVSPEVVLEKFSSLVKERTDLTKINLSVSAREEPTNVFRI